ncbi:MAG: DUF4258 domain-containing protein [Candidatus Aenigmarchaeota archaeon]|nr:DUF4258 domain-containing protein [Candidatus Aenigmarchaeota archaeon]
MVHYFEITCKLGKIVRTTKEYWTFIINAKHPSMKGRKKNVMNTLKDPDEIRKSKRDPKVYLYYREIKKKYICVVCKHLNGEGYIITTYLTSRIMEGESIWKK